MLTVQRTQTFNIGFWPCPIQTDISPECFLMIDRGLILVMLLINIISGDFPRVVLFLCVLFYIAQHVTKRLGQVQQKLNIFLESFSIQNYIFQNTIKIQ